MNDVNKQLTLSLAALADIERDGISSAAIQSGTLYVGLENVTSEGEFVNVRAVEAGELASTKFQFTHEHLLYGKLRPYLRKIARPIFSGVCSTDILPILPRPNLDRGYLFHYLRQDSVVAKANSLAAGANLPRLSPRSLAEFPIPTPPLSEQQRIAAILDQADALRAKRRQALAKLNTLTQSLFLDLFGDPASNPKSWPTKPLFEFASKLSDGPFGSNLKTTHYKPDGIRVVRLQNIGVGEFLDNDKAFISKDHFSTLMKHECLPGDVLVGTLGVPNLRACILPSSIPKALNKADCVQLRPNDKVATAEYICALLNSPSTERMAQSLILGQTRLRISMGRLRDLEVPLPPLPLQSEYSEQVARVRIVKQHLTRSATKLEFLFASLQHRAFRGEL